ncbi:MAG: glycosyltransferase family 2 protein [Candidatus Acidiferrales bacterium]
MTDQKNLALQTEITARNTDLEVSVVMPCLNEEKTIGACVAEALTAMERAGLRGEVVVADNGSTDRSVEIALSLGARVVPVEKKGYGNALLGGFSAARGVFVIMGDADQSYDFTHIPAFVAKLREGYDLVMGNRFRGGIAPGAMPALHRYLGTPVLTAIARLFFGSPCGDIYCGLRGFRRDAILRLGLRTTGMEFATEMVVKSAIFRLRIAEVPTTLRPDGRDRPPHLRTWRDGWRGLRFLMLYSPRWLFLYPGILLMLAGTAAGLWLIPGPRMVHGVTFDVHTLLFAGLAVLLGFQSVAFAFFTKLFAITEGLAPEDPRLNRLFRYVTLEVGVTVGALLMAIGFAAWIAVLGKWGARHFGALDIDVTMRVTIPGAVLIALGFQTFLSSLFLSVLGMARR